MSETQWEGAPAQADEAPESTFNVRDHLRILRKRLWLIVGVIVAAGGLAGAWLFTQPRIYRASGTLHIDTSAPRVLGDVKDVVDLGAGDYWSNKEFYETQYKIIASRDVLDRVVEKEGLDRDLPFLGLDRVEDEAKRAELLGRIDPVAVLEAKLHVDPVKNSQLVQVSIEDTDAARAARLANAVMDAYIERNLDRRLEGTKAASDWLGEQMGDLKSKLESSELALYTFKRDQDILSTSLEDRQNITSQRLVTLNDSLTEVITRKANLAAVLAEIEAARRTSPDDPFWAASIAKVAESKLVADLQRDFVKQENEVAALSQQYGEKHPKLVAGQERLAGLRQRVSKEMANVVESVRSEHRATVDAERRLEALIAGVKREAFELNKREIDYKKLKREEENNQRLYELVLSRLKEADLTALLKANNVNKLDAAIVPDRPVKPRPAVTGLLALVVGAVLGVGLAYALELLDRTLKNEDDVERVLGVPFLGMVPSIVAAGAGKARADDPTRDLFVFHNPKSAAAECTRAIRTNLLFMSPERELRKLVVTSSGPQEGKTTTCINVGVTMAQAGSRVLLVDTDMRRPRLHRAFKLSNEVGLSTLIVGETDVESVVKTTDVPNLFVLPCGPVPPNPPQLLHTERFQEIQRQLEGKYDRVVFDTPPLAAVAAAAVLATRVDGVMLVTRFHRTTRDVATRALRSLRDVKARVLGVVMNDVNLQSRQYDYYYYRRYGQYYSEGGESAKA